MVPVGRRVQEAIDHMAKGELELALTAICIAVDITSQRHKGTTRSSRSAYKAFIREYLWLITYMGFPGLMATTVRVPFNHPEAKPDAAGNIGIDDIVYHVVRCALIHSDEGARRVKWNSAISLGNDDQGNLILSDKLIWGLAGAVVFAPVNKAETLPDTYWLTIADFKMFVSEMWGREDVAKRVINFYTGAGIS